MRLALLQQTYSEAIYGADSKPLESLILDSVEKVGSFTKKARVDIYRNNVLGALKNALSDVYPVCEALVGIDYFNQLTTLHVQQHPSSRRNLDFYGEDFPLTLKELIKDRDELQELAYLADVAQLEWLLHQSYFAPNRTQFDVERFGQLSAEQQMKVKFKLSDDIGLMSTPYPVYDIWHSHQQEGVSFKYKEQEHNYMLVQREQWQSHSQLIDGSLYDLLVAIDQGTELLELTPYLDKSPQDIASLIQQGIVAGYYE